MANRNEGRENFEQSKLTGKWKRVRPDPPKPIDPEIAERLRKLKKIAMQTSDIEKVQADRLATMDFSYMMDPEATAGMMKISKGHAAKLRKMAAYKRRLAELRDRMNLGVDKVIDEDFKKVKNRLTLLVPKALEVLADNLEMDGDLLALQASREVLDRDGRMPKTSRVQTQVQPASKIPTVNDATMEEFGVKPKTDTVN